MNDLLATIGISSEDERIVCGIHEDSRRVGKDWIFISRLGMKGEGKAYVCEALGKGAVVIMEERCAMRDVYVCADVQKALITLSSALYPRLCADLLCIGVTGTSGKSSVSAFLYQMLSADMPCMRIGAHGVRRWLARGDREYDAAAVRAHPAV